MRGWEIDCNINSLIESQRKCPTKPQYQYYEDIINGEIDELVAIKAEIEKVINAVDDNTLQALLRGRYINFKTWESIAESIHYESARWVRTALHSQALQAVEEVIKSLTVNDP